MFTHWWHYLHNEILFVVALMRSLVAAMNANFTYTHFAWFIVEMDFTFEYRVGNFLWCGVYYDLRDYCIHDVSKVYLQLPVEINNATLCILHQYYFIINTHCKQKGKNTYSYKGISPSVQNTCKRLKTLMRPPSWQFLLRMVYVPTAVEDTYI